MTIRSAGDPQEIEGNEALRSNNRLRNLLYAGVAIGAIGAGIFGLTKLTGGGGDGNGDYTSSNRGGNAYVAADDFRWYDPQKDGSPFDRTFIGESRADDQFKDALGQNKYGVVRFVSYAIKEDPSCTGLVDSFSADDTDFSPGSYESTALEECKDRRAVFSVPLFFLDSDGAETLRSNLEKYGDKLPPFQIAARNGEISATKPISWPYAVGQAGEGGRDKPLVIYKQGGVTYVTVHPEFLTFVDGEVVDLFPEAPVRDYRTDLLPTPTATPSE